ncbi:AAA family ATPase [Burkholderia vietnamiensis]|uniref:AAA family ATPase n=1 Tax=Burkholderia vietnamiensis TaxID=60552 RepID=UPI001CF14838|nr:AAA family ATPase [Burkholderia vietnamiensis]MCA8292059.1 AAA family ATPase [Burkholderia vietnamiensis]HDR9165941.1 AAA family ATPase [Burkholderia vietnamiensis]HDR9172656.1 AAA family ATPase [Burkholderia vietnamiensis]
MDDTTSKPSINQESSELFGFELENLDGVAMREPQRHPYLENVFMSAQAAQQPVRWLFEGLMEEGDQMILAGAPKTGKSLMAQQIALALASGGRFLEWQAVEPRRVLYINMEIKREAFGRRVLAQIGGANNLMPYADTWLECHRFRSFNILDPKDRDEVQNVVKASKAALVVWDILARVHSSDEQSAEMKAVMLSIRLASCDRAHIVVHHTRKPSAEATGPQTAMDIRGSSALFGEVDTALVLSKRTGQGARFVITTAARSVNLPDEILLDRDEESLLFYAAAAQEQDRVKTAFQGAFKASEVVLATELTDHIKNAMLVADRRAKDYIAAAVKDGWIKRQQREDRKYEYQVLPTAPFLRIVKSA